MISQLVRRREFLKACAMSTLPTTWVPAEAESASSQNGAPQRRFFFTSLGQRPTGEVDGLELMNDDGTGLRNLKFDVPHQASWSGGPGAFHDARRWLLVSMEKINPNGRPFSEYYGQTPTHLWIYNEDNGSLTEIATKERIAPYYGPWLILPGEERMIVGVILPGNKSGLFSMDLDGTHQKQLWRPEEGIPYGSSLSPNGKRIAFHNVGPPPHSYRIFDCNLDFSDRVLVAGQPDYLYFGPTWSPEGDWLLYSGCQYQTDPGHDWSDICIGRPDGSENRVLTQGQSQWLRASYGNPQHHGDGSNIPQWVPDGRILHICKLPGTKVAWPSHPHVVDVDHFNRDYKPEEARGGTEICLLNPKDGAITRLTHSDPPQWDFRPTGSPDGKRILFCRAKVGELPAIWVMHADGKNQRLLTRGWNDEGADFPRWLPG